MTLAKVKEQDGMTLAKVKEQDGMTLAKVKEQDGMTLAKVKEQDGMTLAGRQLAGKSNCFRTLPWQEELWCTNSGCNTKVFTGTRWWLMKQLAFCKSKP